MKYITIFSLIVNLCIVGYVTYKYFPLYIVVNKTHWCKKIYSITLWRIIVGNRCSTGRTSKGIITLQIRDEDKLMKWDKQMFHSGEYKKYIKE